VRLVLDGSDLPQPLAVCTVVRPDWLTAVVDDAPDRVADIPLGEALERYAQA
jgi:hypothetical protein